ncbi:ATP-binding protein [Sinomonas cyclohexanicum]|nr:type IV secretion system DNA-binding domain-containing protein [Corynebacterium cyclohexanicum]
MTISLAGALGRALAGINGLSYFHLPDGIEFESAVQIVRAANKRRPSSSSPFAILVNAAGSEQSVADDVVMVSAKESVRYRQGDRLAVIFGRQPDLASFLQTFTEVAGPSYPDAADSRLGLHEMSRVLLQALAGLAGQDLDTNSDAVAFLERCLETLRALHVADQQGVGSWNVRWFRHVETGLQNLAKRFHSSVVEGSALSLDGFIQQWCYAAFGLPRPDGSAKATASGAGPIRELADAFHEYWTDESSLKQSLAQIAVRTEDPSFSLVSTDGFNDVVLRTGDPKSGLVEWVDNNPERLDVLARITVADFIDPSGNASDIRLTLALADGGSLLLDFDTPAAPYVVPLTTRPAEGRQPRSPGIEISVPWTGSAQAEIPKSLCSVTVTPKGAGAWETHGVSVETGRLRLRGQFHRAAGTGRNAAQFRPASITLDVDRSHALSGFLPAKLGHKVYFLSPDNALMVVAPVRSDGALGRATAVEPSDDGALEATAEVVPNTRGYQALIWCSDSEADVALNGNPVPAHPVIRELRTIKFAASAESDFTVEDRTFRIRPVAASKGQQSALIAAALKEQVIAERPKPEIGLSIRGLFESMLGRALTSGDAEFRQALGHAAMPSDRPCSLSELRPHWGGSVLMADLPESLLRPHMMNLTFDDPFVNGPEANRFREALDNLGLEKLLGRQPGNASVEFEWPSRTSFRSLWGNSRLDEYLNAYGDLVEAAAEIPNDAIHFWAAYPFSISVWDITTGYHCSTVLLSPLHPLRLAWLAGSESVLDEAQNAKDLLGSLEGWNFPIAGPGPRKTRRMIAVPSDAGEDQIFLGWSVLVPAGSDEGIPLKSPGRIGDYLAPGTAATGLNGASVDAALRSFRRMHPHATTLTVDLAASQPANRVTEIDSAVLSMAQEWTSAESFQGGIRVYDSVLREGAPPRDDVTDLVRENRDLLVTWSRYRPDPSRPVACNVRFLEGAGITARIGPGEVAKGAIAAVPLRRFEAHGQAFGAYESPSYPGVPNEQGDSAFLTALRQVEGTAPAIQAGMISTLLADKSADWTVLGETHVNPAVMAGLMDQYSAGQNMLWEWRPPIFEKSKNAPALVERRPHISIARVPDAFGHDLEHLLTRASGKSAGTTGCQGGLKARVQRTLGRRGVGLASLLSLGGTHVAGALGFYLAFELFDRAPAHKATRLVIPVDAADYFLRILAGGKSEHGQTNRRADLLLLELDDEELVISPVEIKSYGLKTASGPGHPLPSPDSAAFAEALEQLASSYRVIEDIGRTAGSLDQRADRALWFNALATLVETAIKLKPVADEYSTALSARLGRVARGEITVRAGQPILTYFDYTGTEFGEDAYYVGDVGNSELEAVGLVADTRAVFSALDNEKSGLVASWAKLLDRGRRTAEAMDDDAGGEGRFGAHHDDVDEVPDRVTGPHDVSRVHLKSDSSTSSSSTVVPDPQASGIRDGGVKVRIGYALDSIGKAPVDFWPSNTALTQMNIGIVGDLGTGKTEFVKALLAQIRSQALKTQPNEPTSSLIFDYKGDFQGGEFLERVDGKVLRPFKMPLNVFMPVTDEYARKPHQQAAAFVDILSKIYSGIGPVQSSMLKKVIRELFERPGQKEPTLAEVLELYLDEQGKPDSVSAILETFVYGELFDYDRTNLSSFGELLEGRVIVVALNELGQDQDAKNAIVALFLNLYFDYMIRSPKPPFQGADPQLRYLKSFLVVDEAVNIMRYNFSVLMDLMLQGRQFGFGVVLSSQYLSHFDTGKHNYGEPLRTWVIHRVPNVTVKQLGALGLKGVAEKTADRIPSLDKHQVLYHSFGCPEPRLVRVTPYYELYRL